MNAIEAWRQRKGYGARRLRRLSQIEVDRLVARGDLFPPGTTPQDKFGQQWR